MSLFVHVPLSKRSTYIDSLQIYFSCVGKFVPGCYALTVTGELSEEMQVCLAASAQWLIFSQLNSWFRVSTGFEVYGYFDG